VHNSIIYKSLQAQRIAQENGLLFKINSRNLLKINSRNLRLQQPSRTRAAARGDCGTIAMQLIGVIQRENSEGSRRYRASNAK
jgi:hypothetical protein